ncbi:MAG: acyltransferase family protein [Cyanobacteriota bacterium]
MEEQFYFLYPLLLWVTGFARGSGSGSRRLLFWLLPACAASLGLFVVLARHHHPGAYFLMPSRFWELGAGGLLVPLVQALEQSPAGGAARGWLNSHWPAALSAVVALALPACFLIPQQRELEATLLVVGLSVALLALMLTRSHDPVARLLASRWPVRIGLLSYSLYLWHWSVLSLSRWTIGVSLRTLPLQALLLVLLATASYRWVEQPLRRARWSEGSGRTIVYGLLASLGGTALLWALKGPLHQRLYLGSERSRNQRDREWRALAIAGTTITPGACSTDDLDDETLRSPERFRLHVRTCSAEPPGRPVPHLFVVGDSHAMAFAPVAEYLLRTGRYGIGLLGRPSCPFPDTRYGHLARHCSTFQQRTEQELLRHGRPGDVVVVVGYHLSHLGDSQRLVDTRNNFRGADGLPLLGGEAKQAAYVGALNRFARQAAARGLTTVLIGATPRHPDALSCRPEWFNLQNDGHCEREVQQELAHARALNAALRAGLDPVVRFLDPVPVLCGTGRGCENRRVLELLRDTDHLSTYGARQLLAPLQALLPTPQPQGSESRRR